MKCQRCTSGPGATYRVYSDAMEIKVCAACAAEAKRLGLAIELLHPGEVTKVSAKSEDILAPDNALNFEHAPSVQQQLARDAAAWLIRYTGVRIN